MSYSWKLPKGKQPALGWTRHFSDLQEQQEGKNEKFSSQPLSLSLSLILISSDLLSSLFVSSGGGSWRRTVIKHKELNRKHKQMCAQANKQAHVVKTDVCALETTFLCCLFAKYDVFPVWK